MQIGSISSNSSYNIQSTSSESTIKSLETKISILLILSFTYMEINSNYLDKFAVCDSIRSIEFMKC